MVNFQVLADSFHQAEHERYQGHIQLDERHPFNGAHRHTTFTINTGYHKLE